MASRFGSITVEELIEILQQEDPKKKAIFSTDYGDYHHTPQALPIEGICEEVSIVKTGYSNSGFAIVDNDDEDDEDEGPDGVVRDENGVETFLLIR